jgi:ABC-type Zn uptake system ZnuABC Zn-binding protein ZnuA
MSKRTIWAAATTWAVLSLGSAALDAQTLKACCTIPDLALLVSEIGGPSVETTTFVRGPEDPHFIEAKPSFVKALSQADLLVYVGLELEIGWIPVLLQNCRNAAVQPGKDGNIDASTAVSPLGVRNGPVDRSMGDVHALGNPHYLLDPLNGLRVAGLLRDRLSRILPEKKSEFEARYLDFKKRIGTALVGATLAEKYDVAKLALLHENGKLIAFLEKQGDRAALAGWIGRLADRFGTKCIGDHDLWSYFARRFGLDVVGFLEPKPGISPTTKHLGEIVALMKKNSVRLILSAPYFDSRHADVVKKAAGAAVAEMLHQAGARGGSTDYIGFVEKNVAACLSALGN